MARRRLRSATLFTLMAVVAVVMLYPFYYMLNNASRNQAQFDQQNGHSAVSWRQLFTELPVWRELANSTMICATSIALILVVATSAGFAFAKLRYRASGCVFLGRRRRAHGPAAVDHHPRVREPREARPDQHLPRRHPASTSRSAYPFATFLMATYYRGISDDLIEAAVMDGLGYVRTFLRIALPLSWPAIATVTVLQFIQIWDDLLVGLLFLQNPQQRTITVGLAALSAGRTTSIPVLMAGSFVSAVPAIIVYLIFQRYLVRGLTLGMGK